MDASKLLFSTRYQTQHISRPGKFRTWSSSKLGGFGGARCGPNGLLLDTCLNFGALSPLQRRPDAPAFNGSHSGGQARELQGKTRGGSQPNRVVVSLMLVHLRIIKGVHASTRWSRLVPCMYDAARLQPLSPGPLLEALQRTRDQDLADCIGPKSWRFKVAESEIRRREGLRSAPVKCKSWIVKRLLQSIKGCSRFPLKYLWGSLNSEADVNLKESIEPPSFCCNTSLSVEVGCSVRRKFQVTSLNSQQRRACSWQPTECIVLFSLFSLYF